MVKKPNTKNQKTLRTLAAASAWIALMALLPAPSAADPSDPSCAVIACVAGESTSRSVANGEPVTVVCLSYAECIALGILPADSGVPGPSPFQTSGGSIHRFVQYIGHKCSGVVVSVCVDSKGEMTFAPILYWDANGYNPYCGPVADAGVPNPICLKLTGESKGTTVGVTGQASGTLDHMDPKSCLIYTIGGTCTATFTDPDTGNPFHYHWHNQGHGVGLNLNNGWQNHAGTSDARSSDSLIVASHVHQASYTYAPLSQAGPSPPDGW